MSVFRERESERERDEGEKRGDKQKNYCKWGSVSNITVPAEAINTDLTYTHFSDYWRVLYMLPYSLAHTHTHIHTHT